MGDCNKGGGPLIHILIQTPKHLQHMVSKVVLGLKIWLADRKSQSMEDPILVSSAITKYYRPGSSNSSSQGWRSDIGEPGGLVSSEDSFWLADGYLLVLTWPFRSEHTVRGVVWWGPLSHLCHHGGPTA